MAIDSNQEAVLEAGNAALGIAILGNHFFLAHCHVEL